MSLLDKLLGRAPAEAAPDDSWMTEEQRSAKLAWWESRWMDRIVSVFSLLLTTLAILAVLALLGLLGWTLYGTPVPPPSGPISSDMARGASFSMVYIVLGIPLALAALYFVGRFLFNLIVAVFRDPVHRVFKPVMAPFASLLLLAAIAFLHAPIYTLIEQVYFKVTQTHILAKTSMFKTEDKPLAPPP